MPYRRHFAIADDMINNLDTLVTKNNDPFMTSRYVGFVAVSAVTVYELALKDIFTAFAHKKHNVFGIYAGNHFERINGRIKHQQIQDDYIRKFGDRYFKRYRKKIENIERHCLKTHRKSVKSSYNNLITWRNEFAHEGQIPGTVTFKEVVSSYHLGKELIHCVADTMQR